MIEDAVAEFRGTYLQQPPVFSAKKIDGDRAYDLARRNAPVRLQPVEVTATRARRRSSGSGTMLRLRLVCSAGYYVRSLADAIGERLGHRRRIWPGWCGRAAATSRWRTPSGSTCSTGRPHEAAARVIPLAALLPSLPAITLTPRGRVAGRAGRVYRPVARQQAPCGLPLAGPCAAAAPGRPPGGHRRAARGRRGVRRRLLHPGVVLE